jgi:predicted dehydrogenase
MPDSLAVPLRYKPELGKRRDWGIGIVGAGAIVEAAHLPAYHSAGLRVVGIFDRANDRAQRLARQFGVPKVFGTLDDLLSDREIEIVDIAVPPSFQEEIVKKALRADKHLLCQKPLSTDFSQARLLVEEAAKAKRQLAVNENMRWDPAMRASRQLIAEGWIGQPLLATININYWENWASWPWLGESDRLTILFDAIHPLYALRMLFGEPVGLFCSTGRSPLQKERGETRAIITIEFANRMTGLLLDCSTNPTNDFLAAFRFDGTEGSIKGTLGIYYDYPVGRPDTLAFTSKTSSPGVWLDSEIEGRWIPDAFVGPMAALMKSIEDGSEPENSGREHLKTFQVVEAAYRSAAEKRMVSPQEIT